MTSGSKAEEVAGHFLSKKGFKILERNWRTRYCEIDIVAQKKRAVHFVEVKYRKSSAQGGGFDYITPGKLKRMAFAAEVWVTANKWQGDYCLSAIEVSGFDFKVTSFLEDCS